MIAHGRQAHPAPPRQLSSQSKNGHIVYLPIMYKPQNIQEPFKMAKERGN